MLNKNEVFIIAEAGLNHNGDINIAKELVKKAANTGANAVKFQTFQAKEMVAKTQDENQYNLLKKYELSLQDHLALFQYCFDQHIQFLSTPFDPNSTDLLNDLGVQMFKVASGEITNFLLLEHIAKKDKPIILSTGMSYLGEVEEAIQIIRKHSQCEIILLHCVSNYPTFPEDANLRAMQTMSNAFQLPVGYSDHTMGIEIPISAVALGAKVIEKHFTLDCDMEGHDHTTSLNPNDFKVMVQAIRNVEVALGDGIKQPVEKEMPVRELARKSIVAKEDIPAGEEISRELLTVKRPGKGIPSKYIDLLIGKKVQVDIKKDEPLTWFSFMP